ncbi:MAG: glycosyltransferase family 4 protein [Candidatus Nomurabacteria bacterium]|jgi:glycosyltransferase involved in cell wall biosynthesis|nr:glycosyltransferase family 4 protein [Candidatus Nomurabacteria bacterium]
MKKRLVIDARIIDTTTGRYCRGLLEGFGKKLLAEFEVVVLVPPGSREAWQKVYPRFKFVACDIKNYSLCEQFGLWKILRGLKADLVHFCMPQQPIGYALFGKHKIVTTFHDLTLLKTYNRDKNWLVFKIKQAIGRVIFKVALHRSAAILCPSNFTASEVGSFGKIAPEKVSTTYLSGEIPIDFSSKVCYNGSKSSSTDDGLVLPETLSPSSETPRVWDFGRNYLLYVGNQSSYKNIVRLAEAHQKLLKDFPGLHLVLASPPQKATEQNRKLFEKLKYRNVDFMGWLSNEKLEELYRDCKCYCFPSLFEGFGLPGLEAMKLGVPVASSNATCLPEIYNGAAIYFDPLSSDDMAAKIAQVLSDANLRKDLVNNGFRRVETFSWKRCAGETAEVYRRVIG